MSRNSSRFDAGEIAFVVWHEQWDANIHSHADQGVIILAEAEVDGKPTPLLRFNCFDVERSYVYAPDGKNRVCRIDPIADGNPIGWTMRQLRDRLPAMLVEAGFDEIASSVDTDEVTGVLGDLERAAREAFSNGRQTVKHNRGTDIFEAGPVRFGLEMRTLPDDGGLAIHVLSDLCGPPGAPYSEETEILAFDCFRELPHYHYGPRNKNHRYYWDKAVVPDPLEWTLDLLKAGKLRAMIEAAGYPGIAADLDEGVVASLLPALEAKAREMQPKPTG